MITIDAARADGYPLMRPRNIRTDNGRQGISHNSFRFSRRRTGLSNLDRILSWRCDTRARGNDISHPVLNYRA